MHFLKLYMLGQIYLWNMEFRGKLTLKQNKETMNRQIISILNRRCIRDMAWERKSTSGLEQRNVTENNMKKPEITRYTEVLNVYKPWSLSPILVSRNVRTSVFISIQLFAFDVNWAQVEKYEHL